MQSYETAKVRTGLAEAKNAAMDEIIRLEGELTKVRAELAYTKNTLDWLRNEHAKMSDEVRRLRNNPPRRPEWPAQDFGPDVSTSPVQHQWHKKFGDFPSHQTGQCR